MSESTQSTSKMCQVCKKQEGELLRCSKCKAVYYCNVSCQKEDWPAHRKICKKHMEQTASQEDQSSNKENISNKKMKGLDEFTKMEHVGSGNFSTIFRAKSKLDGEVYAIKQIQKNKVQRMRKQADVFMEKHCLLKLKECEHVVTLYKTFQDELSVYFQMEYPQKGQLWECSKSFGIIPEAVYQYYAASVVKALSVLHNQYNIVHRDLKPQNILLDKDHKIKMIDFGTAKDLDRPDIKGAGNGLKGKKPFEHYVGTAHYMAPQCIHNRASQKKSDIYSLGGVLYFLKVGSPPFQGGSEYLTFTKSLQKKLLTCPQLFNDQLQDLIQMTNEKQMDKRPDINEVMKHPYFKNIDFDNLPSYRQCVDKVTPDEKYIQELCRRLMGLLEREKQPSLQDRRKQYKQEIEPIIEEERGKVESEWLKMRLKMVDLQCRTFLNLDDNNNISFTQLYYGYHKEQKSEQILTEQEQTESV